MPTGRQKLAKQLSPSKAAGKLPDAPSWPRAKVTAVTAGGGTDSNSLVTVVYKGATLKLPHFPFYTPAVGHNVVLIRVEGQWHVLGNPVGFP